MDGYFDLLAERATALGGEALGTARVASGSSSLQLPSDTYEAMDAVGRTCRSVRQVRASGAGLGPKR